MAAAELRTLAAAAEVSEGAAGTLLAVHPGRLPGCRVPGLVPGPCDGWAYGQTVVPQVAETYRTYP